MPVALCSPPMLACSALAPGRNVSTAQRPCCILAGVNIRHPQPGQTKQLGIQGIRCTTWHWKLAEAEGRFICRSGHPRQCVLAALTHHRSTPTLGRLRHTSHHQRHLQIPADPRSNLDTTSATGPGSHSAVSTLALLELLLAQPPTVSHTSESSTTRHSQAAETSASLSEAPRVDTSQLSPKPALPSGTPAQTQAGTPAQTPADIWSQAWQPLEAGQAAQAQQANQAQQAKHAQQAQQANKDSLPAHTNTRNAGLPVFGFWRHQQLPVPHLYTGKHQQRPKLHQNSGQYRGSCTSALNSI